MNKLLVFAVFFFILLLVANIVLFAMKLISNLLFWATIIIAAIFAHIILPKIKRS